MTVLKSKDQSDAIYQLIGMKLKEARLSMGLTQKEVAKICGYTRASIVNIEKGRQLIPIYNLLGLCKLYKVDDVNQLLPSKEDYPNFTVVDWTDVARNIVDESFNSK